MSRFLLLLVSLTTVLSSWSHAADSNGAVAAMRALPRIFQTGIARISADNASPNPQTWWIVARDRGDRGVPTNFAVTAGQVVSERPTLNPRNLLSGGSPIDLHRVQVDSDDAWDIAARAMADRGRRLGSVSFVLQQHGSGASPIWSVWCYDRSGRYIGFVSLLATNGTVVSSD